MRLINREDIENDLFIYQRADVRDQRRWYCSYKFNNQPRQYVKLGVCSSRNEAEERARLEYDDAVSYINGIGRISSHIKYLGVWELHSSEFTDWLYERRTDIYSGSYVYVLFPHNKLPNISRLDHTFKYASRGKYGSSGSGINAVQSLINRVGAYRRATTSNPNSWSIKEWMSNAVESNDKWYIALFCIESDLTDDDDKRDQEIMYALTLEYSCMSMCFDINGCVPYGNIQEVRRGRISPRRI